MPPAGYHPTRICEIELDDPLPVVSPTDQVTGRRYAAAHILVRLSTEPLGVLELPIPPGGLAPERLAERIWSRLGALIARRLGAAGRRPPVAVPLDGFGIGVDAPYLRGRAEVLADAPSISVVLCTRNPGGEITRCLAALDRQEYPDYEVVVVDNAPTSEVVSELVDAGHRRAPFRRVVEQRPGVAWARNRGWREACGAVVAYVDDDEVADRHWLSEIARGLRARPPVAAVTGMILPAALDTEAQYWFEQFGGHSKGRGWTPVVFDRASHAVQHPLYPLPPFGATGNLAVRRTVLAELGGFDVAMGTGTPALGSEDTALLCDLMLAGHTLVYQPTAMVRHRHYDDWSGIAAQLYGYGAGMSAFYTRAVLRDPRCLATLARLTPTALRELVGRRASGTGSAHGDYPAELDRLERRGMRHGPLGYLRSRRVQRRVATAHRRAQAGRNDLERTAP